MGMYQQNNKNVKEYSIQNCGKLNAAATPYFNGGLVKMRKTGKYPYMSTRNSNFSNRNQKGLIIVKGKNDDKDKDKRDEGTLQLDDGRETRAVGIPQPEFLQARVRTLRKDEDPTNIKKADIGSTTKTDSTQDKDNDVVGDGDVKGCSTRKPNVASAPDAGVNYDDLILLVAGIFGSVKIDLGFELDFEVW